MRYIITVDNDVRCCMTPKSLFFSTSLWNVWQGNYNEEQSVDKEHSNLSNCSILIINVAVKVNCAIMKASNLNIECSYWIHGFNIILSTIVTKAKTEAKLKGDWDGRRNNVIQILELWKLIQCKPEAVTDKTITVIELIPHWTFLVNSHHAWTHEGPKIWIISLRQVLECVYKRVLPIVMGKMPSPPAFNLFHLLSFYVIKK